MSVGGALFVSSALGASPIDSVMLSLFHRRQRVPLFAVRSLMEACAFGLGWYAGGSAGIGSAVIGLGIGPGIHLCLLALDRDRRTLGDRDLRPRNCRCAGSS